MVYRHLEKEGDYLTLNFTGYSMYPHLKPGDRVILRSASPERIETGDIVAVPDLKGDYVIHRLVKKLPDGKGLLKGDSMLASDPTPINLLEETKIVTSILRDNRLIPLTGGAHSKIKKLYAFLSLKNLTFGAFRLYTKLILKRVYYFGDQKQQDIEWNFILDLLKGNAPIINKGLNLNKILKISFAEGVAGPVFLYLKQKNISKSSYSIMEKAYNANIVLNMQRISMLEQLEQALDDIKIEVMTLKGASLLENIYQDIGLRPMGDIDLLVHSGDRDTITRLLVKLGYRSDKHRTHIYLKDGISIDIHVHALNTDRIVNRRFLLPRGMNPVWQNSKPWKDGFKWIRRPDDPDNIILLSLHMMKHSFEKLIWLYDVLLVIRNCDGSIWNSLQQRAGFLKTGRQIKYVLYLLERVFSLTPPKGINARKNIKHLDKFEMGLLEERVKGHPIEKSGTLLSLFCVNGLKQKMNFLFETILPKSEISNEEFNQPYERNKFFFSLNRSFYLTIILVRNVYAILRFYVKS